MTTRLETYGFLTSARFEEVLFLIPEATESIVEQYPSSFDNILDCYHLEPFPENYHPQSIDIYYTEMADSPGMYWNVNSSPQLLSQEVPMEDGFLAVWVDGNVAYQAIKGKTYFDRLGGIVLPDLFKDLEQLAMAAMESAPS